MWLAAVALTLAAAALWFFPGPELVTVIEAAAILWISLVAGAACEISLGHWEDEAQATRFGAALRGARRENPWPRRALRHRHRASLRSHHRRLSRENVV
jgi:hypothetical protein